MMQIRAFLSNNKYWIISLGVIAFFLLPYFILGQDVCINDFDNLDYNVVALKILSESGKMFGCLNAEIPQFLNGLPRNVLGSEFNFVLWLYMWFKPFTAYVLSDILARFIGFFGMYLLLKNHVLDKANLNKAILFGVSTLFALLPIWTPLSFLTVLGQPLALYAFLNIRAGKSKCTDWLILTSMPFCASFELSYFFFIIALGCVWLYDVIKTRQIHPKFFLSILYMTIAFCLVNYRLFLVSFFDSTFISHRVEFNLTNGLIFNSGDFFRALETGLLNVFWGDGYYHAKSMQNPFLLIAISLGLYETIHKLKDFKKLLFIVLVVFLISSFHSLWCYWDLLNLAKESVPFLKSFQFDRFYFLNPLLWYIAFALSLQFIARDNKLCKKIVVALLLLSQAFILFYSNMTFYNGCKSVFGKNIKVPTYSQFFAQKQFEDIKNYINKPQSTYRVASLGIHPSISQYNGFYTIDGYFMTYPLKYKHKFRKAIEKELDKSLHFKTFYDYWGSRVYLFSAELADYTLIHPVKKYIDKSADSIVECNEFNKYIDHLYYDKYPHAKNCSYVIYGKKYFSDEPRKKVAINNLELNSEVLKELGCEYIISAVDIKNHKENNLKLEKVFDNDESYYRIYLYRVK